MQARADEFNDVDPIIREEEKHLYRSSLQPLTRPEEMERFVKRAMKQLLYLKALKLKDAIHGDVQQTEIILRESVDMVKSYRTSLLTIEEGRQAGLSLPKEIHIIREHLNRILSFVTQYQIKLEAMKKIWEYFRTDYKEEVLKIINGVLTNRADEGCDDLICWETFLPQKMRDDAAGQDDAFKSEYMPSSVNREIRRGAEE